MQPGQKELRRSTLVFGTSAEGEVVTRQKKLLAVDRQFEQRFEELAVAA